MMCPILTDKVNDAFFNYLIWRVNVDNQSICAPDDWQQIRNDDRPRQTPIESAI